jgi:hypothetical protein
MMGPQFVTHQLKLFIRSRRESGVKHCLVRCALVVSWGVLALSSGAYADELEVKGPLAKPALFMSATSVEQLIGEFNYTMDAVERHDIVKLFQEWRESSENLKGMDFTRPVGGMLLIDYLSPVWIGFVPISDKDHFRKTLESFELEVEETDTNQYRVRGGAVELFAVVREGYAYFSDQKGVLKRRLPNPEEYTKQLHEDYDFAITGQLTAIPDFLRNTAAEWIRTQANETDKTEEKDKATDKAEELGEKLSIDTMTAVVRDTDRITLGWSVNRQERQARLDLLLTAKPGSPMAAQLNSLKSTKSRMSRLVSPTAGFVATATFDYNAIFREFRSLIVESARESVLDEKDKESEVEQKIAKQLAEIISRAFDADRIDAALQFDGEPGALVALFGWSVPQADQLQKDLLELFSIQKNEDGSDLALLEEYRGTRIYSLDDAGELEAKTFGKDARTCFAISSDAIWVVMGGKDALPTLKKTLDASADQKHAATDRPPLDITIHAMKMQMFGDELDMMVFDDDEDEEMRELVEKAFKDADDRIRFELAGIENGTRLRASVGEGFIRLAGLSIAKGLDDSGLLKQ